MDAALSVRVGMKIYLTFFFLPIFFTSMGLLFGASKLLEGALSGCKVFDFHIWGRPHAILWSLWLERNNRVFEEQSTWVERLISHIKELAWSWVLNEQRVKETRVEEIIFTEEGILTA